MKTWKCPECGSGVRGPERPRKNNVVRYCLPCSGKAGVLVERIVPALEVKRKAAKVRASKKAATKRSAALQREKQRRMVDGYDMGLVFLATKKLLVNNAQTLGVPGCNVSDLEGIKLHMASSAHPSPDVCHVSVRKGGSASDVAVRVVTRTIWQWYERDGYQSSSGGAWATIHKAYNQLRTPFFRSKNLPNLPELPNKLSVQTRLGNWINI